MKKTPKGFIDRLNELGLHELLTAGDRDAFLSIENTFEPYRQVEMGLLLRRLTMEYLQNGLTKHKPAHNSLAKRLQSNDVGAQAVMGGPLGQFVQRHSRQAEHADAYVLILLAELLEVNLVLINHENKPLAGSPAPTPILDGRPTIVIQHDGKQDGVSGWNLILNYNTDQQEKVTVYHDGGCGFHCFAVALRKFYQDYNDNLQAEEKAQRKASSVPRTAPAAEATSSVRRDAKIEVGDDVSGHVSIPHYHQSKSITQEEQMIAELNDQEVQQAEKTILQQQAILLSQSTHSAAADDLLLARTHEETSEQIKSDYLYALKLAFLDIKLSTNPCTLLPAPHRNVTLGPASAPAPADSPAPAQAAPV